MKHESSPDSLDPDIEDVPESLLSSISKCLNSGVLIFDIFSDILRLLLKYFSALMGFGSLVLHRTMHSMMRTRRQMRRTMMKKPILDRMAISISDKFRKKIWIFSNNTLIKFGRFISVSAIFLWSIWQYRKSTILRKDGLTLTDINNNPDSWSSHILLAFL